MNVVATDSEEIDFELKTHKKRHEKPHGKVKKCPKYKKTWRPCLICGKSRSRLKRHILTKHKQEQKVIPLLKLNTKEQDFAIDQFKRETIGVYNIKCLNEDQTGFLRERKTPKDGESYQLYVVVVMVFLQRKIKVDTNKYVQQMQAIYCYQWFLLNLLSMWKSFLMHLKV